MFKELSRLRPLFAGCTWEIGIALSLPARSCMLLAAITLSSLFSLSVCAQQTTPTDPVIVQPGAPGKPTRVLPATTTGKLPPPSAADVSFMQGMIMHHAQAVEMTALIQSHTENKEL